MNETQLNHWLEITPEPSNTDQWMAQILQTGIDALNLETGIISRINNKDYIVNQAVSKANINISPGDQYELNNTYCEAVVRQGKTITYIEVGTIPEMRLHPVYKALHLESYIGTPIINPSREVIGTVSFTSHNARAMIFSANEINYIEKIARRLGQLWPKY